MIYLAQVDPNLLSITGVIATILSVIFGIAAFYNSRTRKQHLRELERSQRQEHAIHFRPAKSSSPSASRHSVPNRSSKPHQTSGVHSTERGPSPGPKPAPIAKPAAKPASRPDGVHETDNMMAGSDSYAKDTPPLFRKVKPSGSGNIHADSGTDDQENYVWE